MLGYWLVVVVAKRLMMDLSNIPSNTSYPHIHYLHTTAQTGRSQASRNIREDRTEKIIDLQ